MQVVSVPYYIGQRMDGFVVPQPARMLDPPLPHEDAGYDTFRADGPGGVPQLRVASLYTELAHLAARTAEPLVYAGGCLAVIGVLAAFQRKGIDSTLYWFDAHVDFHTWETTPSKFLGGMPLLMFTGRGEQTIVEATGLRPIGDDRVVLVDARDLDRGEDEAVMHSNMTVMSISDVATLDPAPGPIYVHVDDGDDGDPSDMPAVNYRAPNGPSAEAVSAPIEQITTSGRVVAARCHRVTLPSMAPPGRHASRGRSWVRSSHSPSIPRGNTVHNPTL